MGLTILVGLLAQQKDELEHLSLIFKNLNSILLQNALLPHNEPMRLSEKDRFEAQMMGYGGLHYVRRLASHLAIHNALPPPTTDYQIADSDDPAIEALFARLEKNGFRSTRHGLLSGIMAHNSEMFAHLMLHSDTQGFYIPQDFEDVVFDENEPQLEGLGGMVGSTFHLLRECEILAKKIGLPVEMHHDSEELWEFSDCPASSGPLWQVYGIESFGLARLMEACRVSIRSGAAIAFA